MGCGSSVDPGDDGLAPAADDAAFDGGAEVSLDAPLDGDADVATDADDAEAPFTGCGSVPASVDPDPSIDPATKGPLPVGHKILKIPTLGPLTDVAVKVTYPAKDDGVTPAPGRHAWIMFHHAVHGPYPGVVYDDYPTIHDHWASHGFVVFSIDGARVFFPTTMGTNLTWAQQQTVAGMMSDAITWYLAQQEKPEFELGCLLDKDRLAVAGHSRGGGATLLVPTTRTDGAKIKGLVSLQGVDPGALNPPTGAEIPGFDLPAMWFDAALDGDVVFPIDALQYGRTHANASIVTILGSKHTFTFDAHATPDQGGAMPTITPAEHKAVCVQYSTAFLRAYVRDASPTAADLDRISGPGGLSSTVSSGGVLLSYRPKSGFSGWIAKFDASPPDGAENTESGTAVTATGAMKATPLETYASSITTMGSGTKAVSKSVLSIELQWDGTGGALEVPIAPTAVAGKKAIVFDVAMPSETTTSGTTPLVLELDDSAGGAASVNVKDYLGAGWFTRPRRFSTAYVPLAKLSGVDVTKATKLRLLAPSGATAGTAMIDSLRAE